MVREVSNYGVTEGQVVCEQVENHLENLINSVILLTKQECHRTAAEHMNEGLSLSTEPALTGMRLGGVGE